MSRRLLAFACLAVLATGCGTGLESRDLRGSWRVVSVEVAGGPPVGVTNPALFTVEFAADDRLNVRADCNSCGASWTASNDTLVVGPVACTRAFCTSSAPLDSRFLELLQAARTWTIRSGELELRSPAGTLRLRP